MLRGRRTRHRTGPAALHGEEARAHSRQQEKRRNRCEEPHGGSSKIDGTPAAAVTREGSMRQPDAGMLTPMGVGMQGGAREVAI